VIDTLPLLTPDASRSTRVVARCHEKLERRRRRIEGAQRQPRPRTMTIERAIAGAFCVIYAAAVISNALRVLFAG
jgi:hypothetical protein